MKHFEPEYGGAEFIMHVHRASYIVHRARNELCIQIKIEFFVFYKNSFA